jgi:hypothetical protein
MSLAQLRDRDMKIERQRDEESTGLLREDQVVDRYGGLSHKRSPQLIYPRA